MTRQPLDQPEVRGEAEMMPVRPQIESALLTGQAAAGVPALTPVQRRLFRYLLTQPSLPASPYPQPYTDGLIGALQREEDADKNDQAARGDGAPAAPIAVERKTWWPSRIETRSFGGQNTLDGAFRPRCRPRGAVRRGLQR